MRLIDADALMNEKVWLAEISEDARVFRFAVPCGVIANAPTIDAEPVKHGEVVIVTDRWNVMHQECSVCGNRIEWGRYPHYCPNCGAKMDGEDIK